MGKYSDDLYAKATEMRKNGMSEVEISLELGINRYALRAFFIRNNIRLSDEQKKKLFNSNLGKRKNINTDGTIKCTRCEISKDPSQYNKDSSQVHGLSYYCKECERLKNRTRCKADYLINPDKYKERNNRYVDSHKDIVNQRKRAWEHKNTDRVRAQKRKWDQNNKFHRNYIYENYRAAKISATPKWLTRDHKDEMLNFYENCLPGYHVDHIEPLVCDISCGLHVPWNLQYLPANINIRKSNRRQYDGHVGVCHQYRRRLDTIVEDVASGLPTNTRASEYILSPETLSDEHRKFIEKYEWLGTIGFGVRWVFAARYNGILGGVVMISEPTAYSGFGKDVEALIQRGACASWTPKNLGSRLIMFACRWMINNTNKRLFVAYSDPEAGEIGTIYQACNFDYMGSFYGSKYSYRLSNGKLVGSRYFTRTSAVKKWAKELNITWLPEWCKPNGFQDVKAIPKNILKKLRDYGKSKMLELDRVEVTPKGKYALLLWKNKKEKKELLIRKNWESLPYPKRSISPPS